MIKIAIQGIVTVGITAIVVIILRFVVWQMRRVQIEMKLMQAHEIRDVLEDFTEKVIRIQKSKNGGKVPLDDAEGMLADAIRESGLDPSQYFLEGLIRAKQHEIEERAKDSKPPRNTPRKRKPHPEAGSHTF